MLGILMVGKGILKFCDCLERRVAEDMPSGGIVLEMALLVPTPAILLWRFLKIFTGMFFRFPGRCWQWVVFETRDNGVVPCVIADFFEPVLIVIWFLGSSPFPPISLCPSCFHIKTPFHCNLWFVIWILSILRRIGVQLTVVNTCCYFSLLYGLLLLTSNFWELTCWLIGFLKSCTAKWMPLHYLNGKENNDSSNKPCLEIVFMLCQKCLL